MNDRRKKLIENYYKNKIPSVELIIDNVWDPHNVAAVSRTADGLGIGKINLYYTYNKFPDFSKTGKKTSSSATKWINFEKIHDLDFFTQEKKKEGFKFIGSIAELSQPRLNDFKFPDKCIIILGSESKGMSSELMPICDQWICIPMVGMVESYNISVAAALLMYEVYRQRGEHLVLRTPSPPRD